MKVNDGCHGLEEGINEELLFNGYKISVIQSGKSAKELLYNIVHIVNTVLYI